MSTDEATNDGSWYSNLNEAERDDLVARVAAQLEDQDGAKVSRRDLLKAAGVGMAGLSLGAGAVASDKINADDFMHRASAQSAAAGQVGTSAEPVDVFASEFSFANGNSGFSGRLSDRPAVSTQAREITVGTDTSTIQEALNQIPLLIRHNLEIVIPDGTYNEDLLVPPFMVADTAGMNRDDVTNEGASHLPRITGNITTPTNVKVNSITVTGTNGAIAPLIEGMQVTASTPYADEGAGVDIYGCQNVSFRHISFAGTAATRGFLPYGSGVTLRAIDFGSNDMEYGIETKHNANVNLDDYDGTTTGSVTKYVIWNNDGSVVTFMGVSATGGQGFINNREGHAYNADIREYEPAVGARATSTVVDQAITTGTQTTVQFDTTEYDRKGDFNTTSHAFVAPVSGRYHIETQVQWLGPADTTEMQLRVRETTGDKGTLASSRLGGSVHTNPTQSVSTIAGLNPSNEVVIEVLHDEGADVSINTDNGPLTYFAITRLN